MRRTVALPVTGRRRGQRRACQIGEDRFMPHDVHEAAPTGFMALCGRWVFLPTGPGRPDWWTGTRTARRAAGGFVDIRGRHAGTRRRACFDRGRPVGRVGQAEQAGEAGTLRLRSDVERNHGSSSLGPPDPGPGHELDRGWSLSNVNRRRLCHCGLRTVMPS